MPLGMLLEMAADTWPDRAAVGRRPGGLTAAQLRAAALGGARALRETGAGSVAFLDVNGPGFVVALWSAALAGLPFCPLNYRMSAEQLPPLLATLDEPLVVGAQQYQELLAGASV